MRKLHLSLIALLLSLSLAVPALAQPQPHMTAALSSLESAKAELDKATADKGGHRVKAIELINQAMEEVRKGIEFAKKN
jgi:outer membrane lipoprotein-sorting protein